MRFLLLTAFLGIFVLFSAAYAQDDEAFPKREKTFNAEHFVLDNGMNVVVIPNHRAPVVTHMVWYGVGAADEPRGHSGLAHFLEHLMFKGTQEIPPGAFSKRIRALGGRDNAFTGKDFTAYHQSIAAEHLETVMAMEADRMKNLILPPEEVKSELLVVIEERRQRTDNTPTGHFFEQMYALLFPNHPYSIPVIGWMHELQAMTPETPVAFYRTWYAPNNAYLIISGDTSAAEVRPLAEKTYGQVPAQDLPERHWPEVPELYANPRLKMHHPDIQQPAFYRLYRAPSANQDKQASLALEVLGSILDHGQNSRLYKSLVVEQKLATGVNFNYGSSARSDAVITISASPAPGVSLETLERAIEEELRTLVRDGVTAQEVSDATTRLRDAYTFSRDSLQGPAMIFGYNLMTGASIEDIEYWASDIAAVNAEQINDVARRYLDPDNPGKNFYVTGYVMPEVKEAASEKQETGEAAE